jgi:hypothetical protein
MFLIIFFSWHRAAKKNLTKEVFVDLIIIIKNEKANVFDQPYGN